MCITYNYCFIDDNVNTTKQSDRMCLNKVHYYIEIQNVVIVSSIIKNTEGKGIIQEAPSADSRQITNYMYQKLTLHNNNNNKALLPYSTCKSYMINWNVVWR